MNNHPPKGFLSIYTNGKVCIADGQGNEEPINVVEILAECEQLRAEVQRLKQWNTNQAEMIQFMVDAIIAAAKKAK